MSGEGCIVDAPSNRELHEDEAVALACLRDKPHCETVRRLQKYFVLASEISDSHCHTLIPSARRAAVVNGLAVYWRADLSVLKTSGAWLFYGREVKPHEVPCNWDASCNGCVGRPLFSKWQTRPILHLPSEASAASSSADRAPVRTLEEWQVQWCEHIPTPDQVSSSQQAKRRVQSEHTTRQTEWVKKRSVGAFGLRLKLNKMLENFENGMEQLTSWVKRRGYLPWIKGATREERRLATWIATMCDFREKLPADRQRKLETVRGWTWEQKSAKEPLSSSSDSSDDSSSPAFPRNKRRRKCRIADSDEDDDCFGWEGGRALSGKELQVKWKQIITMQLMSELAAEKPASIGRRACLRRWQLMYHPDKNPGRADEVMPIFRWVMSMWKREYGTAVCRESYAEARRPGRKTSGTQAAGATSSKSSTGQQHGHLNQKRLRGVRKKRLRVKMGIGS